MAKQDALVAIENAVHKLEQPPSSIHNVDKLKSVKSKLQRWGSRLDKFNSITDLTEVREFAYDVEDVMDDAIMADAAEPKSALRRWRKLKNAFVFFSTAHQTNQEIVDKQIEAIDLRTASIARSTSCCNDDDIVYEEEDLTAQISQENDVDVKEDLFYLSLSGFHAGEAILARQLIQIWVAEGFVTMEEQGRVQINRLIETGFINQAELGTCGNLKTFTITNDKLDACRSIAETENHLHVKLITGQNDEETSQLKATRLAIHSQNRSLLNGNNVINGSFNDLSKLRFLQIHCYPCNSSSNRPLDHGFLKKEIFGSLRVLDLGCIGLEIVPEAIGKLAHLRYLRLRAPEANKIPASICNLQNLQTIDLKETKHVKAMPVEIWKMKKNLRHLHLGGATALPPPRMVNHYDALVNLQTLCGVRPDKELKRLMVRAKFPNVNRLRLHLGNKRDPAVEFLNSLDHLHYLRSLTLRGPIQNLPSDSNAFPSTLIKMTLSGTRIPADKCVATLQNLPNLMYLKLMEDSLTGIDMKCDAGGFPALQALRLKELKELKYLTVEKSAMRLVKKLEVIDCVNLERFEAFQPSKDLKDTLERLQRAHPAMAVQINTTPPPKSNGVGGLTH